MPNVHYQQLDLSGGAYIELSELIRLRHAASDLDKLNTRRIRNPLSGMMSSHIRGRGMDFTEVRVYQPGDDVRTIDWRVTARTQVPHTKVFQEEKERPVLILVDQTQSMFFGSRVAFKSVIAAEIAALLAWAALENGDRTGGIVFSDTGHHEIRPRRNKRSVLRLLNTVYDFNRKLQRDSQGGDSNYLLEAIQNVRRVAKHGSSIYIVSDFQAFEDAELAHFNQLCRHNDVIGIQISDPLERHLPDPNLYAITNGTDRVRINTGNRRYREQFEQTYLQRITGLRSLFARQGAQLLEISTDESILDALFLQAARARSG
jgi:uncharacterized protein (DUF58 family)